MSKLLYIKASPRGSASALATTRIATANLSRSIELSPST